MKLITIDENYIQNLRKEIMDQITKELSLDKVTKEANESLKRIRMTDGSFSFQKSFKFEKKFDKLKPDRRATLRITPEAFTKMFLIITDQEKEVGWHGVTERISETEFVLKDILVYPQQVTACTVDTDDEEYAKWLIRIGEDNFNNLHFHGHSHVNMSVSPSKTDMDHRAQITSQLNNDQYYIFMIWNKSLKWSGAIYDMASNIQYETDDIDVIVPFSDGTTAGSLLKELDNKVKSYTPTVSKYPTYGGNTKSAKEDRWGKGGSAAGNGRDDFRGYYENRYYYDW